MLVCLRAQICHMCILTLPSCVTEGCEADSQLQHLAMCDGLVICCGDKMPDRSKEGRRREGKEKGKSHYCQSPEGYHGKLVLWDAAPVNGQ